MADGDIHVIKAPKNVGSLAEIHEYHGYAFSGIRSYVKMTIDEIIDFLHHRSAWQYASRYGADTFLVMDSRAYIQRDVVDEAGEFFNRILDVAPPEWDVIMLSHNRNRDYLDIRYPVKHSNCLLTTPPANWCHPDAYIITREGVQKVFELMNETTYSIPDAFTNVLVIHTMFVDESFTVFRSRLALPSDHQPKSLGWAASWGVWAGMYSL